MGGDNNPPVTVGDITAPPAVTDYPTPAEIFNTSSEAPLGTDPAYDVEYAAPEVVSHTVSKAGSELAEQEMFKINWITVARAGEAPDPDAVDLVFNEGDSVKLWVQYEVVGDLDHSRIWTIPESGLAFTEEEVNLGAGGVYTVALGFTLPYGSASTEASFTIEMGPAKSVSTNLPGGLTDSETVSLVINAVPVLPPINYPTRVDGHAQMAWEDLIANSDYDYNDLVASMHVTEWRNENNELVEIDLEVKALARGAGYDADWQFNMDAAFPGTTVTAIVDQYYDDGDGDHTNDVRHGPQRIWNSSNGASVPVFAPTRQALPLPPDHSWATNAVAGTTYMEGDYALVKIVLDTPLAQGTYTPIPYEPELRVQPSGGSPYVIGLWRQPGDPVDSNGRPLGFIVPDTWQWPLECKRIWSAYPETFAAWVSYINTDGAQEPNPVWFDTVPVDSLVFSRDKFLP
ncbi:LruC domain-containing protein [bacterium]|nr:LruC domain-containing protein [bacterium]